MRRAGGRLIAARLRDPSVQAHRGSLVAAIRDGTAAERAEGGASNAPPCGRSPTAAAALTATPTGLQSDPDTPNRSRYFPLTGIQHSTTGGTEMARRSYVTPPPRRAAELLLPLGSLAPGGWLPPCRRNWSELATDCSTESTRYTSLGYARRDLAHGRQRQLLQRHAGGFRRRHDLSGDMMRLAEWHLQRAHQPIGKICRGGIAPPCRQLSSAPHPASCRAPCRPSRRRTAKSAAKSASIAPSLSSCMSF